MLVKVPLEKITQTSSLIAYRLKNFMQFNKEKYSSLKTVIFKSPMFILMHSVHILFYIMFPTIVTKAKLSLSSNA
jgi:hypothetical protein